MAPWTSRTVHSALALPLLAPLALTVATGFAYRFARAVLHVDKGSVQWLLSLHSMALLGLGAVYPPLVAALVLATSATGLWLSSIGTVVRRLMAGNYDIVTGVVGLPSAPSFRVVHRGVTATINALLVLSAVTGAVWTVQQYWLGYTRKQSGYLMGLHQGSFTGSPVVYTGVLCAFTSVALASGYNLVPWSKKTVKESGAMRGKLDAQRMSDMAK